MICPHCHTPIHADTDAPPANSKRAHWTSMKASAGVRTGSQRARVLTTIAASRHGLTDEEVGTALSIPGNSVRPRRGELVALGLVEDTGTTRPIGPNGNHAIVWAATLAGFGEYRRLGAE